MGAACCVAREHGETRGDIVKNRDVHNALEVKMTHLCDYVNLKSGEHCIETLDGKTIHGRSLKQEEDALGAEDDVEESVSARKLSIAGVQNPIEHEILERLEMIFDVLSNEEDMLHSQWDGPDGRDPLSYLFDCDDNDKIADDFMQLNDLLQEELKSHSGLNRVDLPAKVFGDLHGQFRDLVLFLKHFGMPGGVGAPNFVFNGDWVDRGKHQLEVLAVVYALKLAFPANVCLNRGNHEDGVVNSHSGEEGFECACIKRFGEERGAKVFAACASTFEWLPLGTVVADRVLVVHGGIGEGKWLLSHLENAPRPLSDEGLESDHVFYNVLWSDPVDEDQKKSFGVHQSPRDGHMGLILGFGHDVTKRFLKNNGLGMIIRSHQANHDGDGYELMHDGHLARVFSARDYEGNTNDGSIMFIQQKDGKIWVRPQVLHSCLKERPVASKSEGGGEDAGKGMGA